MRNTPIAPDWITHRREAEDALERQAPLTPFSFRATR